MRALLAGITAATLLAAPLVLAIPTAAEPGDEPFKLPDSQAADARVAIKRGALTLWQACRRLVLVMVVPDALRVVLLHLSRTRAYESTVHPVSTSQTGSACGKLSPCRCGICLSGLAVGRTGIERRCASGPGPTPCAASWSPRVCGLVLVHSSGNRPLFGFGVAGESTRACRP